MRELADARERSRKVRRAAGVASLSGWTMAVFAAGTLAAAAFGDMVSLALGIGLSVITYNELRGARLLRQFRPGGAKLLGYNQLALGVLIVAYAGWSMGATLRSPALASVGSTGDPDMDRMISGLTGVIAYGVYGTIAVLGVIVPGLTAWYYFSRGRLVRAMVERTPAWVIETMRVSR
jgi:hypothetical protein